MNATVDLAYRWRVDPEGPGMEAVYEIVDGAARYWRSFDKGSVHDFVVQYVGEGSVIFGGWRRLRWTPRSGYRPVETDANARAFNEFCNNFGPIPPKEAP